MSTHTPSPWNGPIAGFARSEIGAAVAAEVLKPWPYPFDSDTVPNANARATSAAPMGRTRRADIRTRVQSDHGIGRRPVGFASWIWGSRARSHWSPVGPKGSDEDPRWRSHARLGRSFSARAERRRL